jgi:tetraacyldisaccharide 4'-kinase
MSWGNPQNSAERAVQAALAPAAFAYGMGSFVRTLAYATGALSRTTLPAKVISIGNLSCGGTGKTPIAIDLAQRIASAGYRTAILSRGYKRRSSAAYVVVSDGKQLLASCEDAGDEPYLIAQSVPDAAVIVGADRVMTGWIAVEQFGAQVILLDDGFQHIRLKRDADVVLLDYNEDLERDRLLPAGRLREPPSALGRAASVVISKVPVGCESDRIERLTRKLRKYNAHADISYCQFKPKADAGLKGARTVAFCGIAKPQLFVESARHVGASVVNQIFFEDHHWYSQKDLEKIEAIAKKEKADFIVTTQKDLVRLPSDQKLQRPIIAIKQETVWLGDLPRAIAEILPQNASSETSPSQGKPFQTNPLAHSTAL